VLGRVRFLRAVVVSAAVAVTVAGCSSGKSGDGDGASGARPERPAPAVAPEVPTDPAAIAARLSDEDLVGQVLMPHAYGTDAVKISGGSREGNRKLGGVDTPAQLVEKYRLGGLILVRRASGDATAGTNPTSNIDSPPQVRKLTAGLQSASATLPAAAPLLIGTDQEHGTVTRIRDGVTLLPSAMAFGAATDPRVTEAASRVSGTELAALGINVDFAPVADVTGGPGNAVIGSRSFGADPALVGQRVAAAVRGYESAGVGTALKHFPGHGHTSADSHDELPVLKQDRSKLLAGDVAPFRSGIAAGASLVMTGHLDVRALDPGTPATFSRKVLVDLLRGQLGFKGVVISDALNMGAVTKRYPAGEAAVRAMLAGNDVLLMPPDLRAAQRGLLDAVSSGRVPRAQLVASVTRILTLKKRLAIARQPAIETLATPTNQNAVAAAAAAAVTQFRGSCGAPLIRQPVTVTGGTARHRDALTRALKRNGVRTGTGETIHLVGYGDDRADLKPAGVTVALDTPYLLSSATSPVLLATYSGVPASLDAVAAVIAGKARATGRSPVPVAGLPRTSCR
jgi:beta-N-acetylhexosaminidase